MKPTITNRLLFAVTCFGILPAAAMANPITDFTSWTLTQDPANALFTATNSPTNAFLVAANGTVPAGTDIGFASINGTTVSTATGGNYFSQANSFSLAINYNISTFNPAFISGIYFGFGIGEDTAGMNSAGVTLGVITLGGAPQFGLGSSARINDVTQTATPIAGAFALSGTFFVSYHEPSGSVTVGAANVMDALAPTGTHTFTGIANSWQNKDLLASFFMRSDNPSGLPLWNGNSANTSFSNFRILEGSATAIPEPNTVVFVLIGSLGMLLRRKLSRS